MIKTTNKVHLEGLLYQHKLEIKVTGKNSKNPGTQYITGTIEIVTDDAHLNTVPVHFSYVTQLTKKNLPNNTYIILENIINGVYKTVMGDGVENATMLSIDTTIGLNEFYTDGNGKEEFVSVKRNEGGFLHVVKTIDEDEKERNKFVTDMVITNFSRLEADEERDLPERGILKGCIFDFKNEMLPVEFSVTNENALNYFEDLAPSANTPVFTQVWGRQISQTIVKKITKESAFGEAYVTETRTSKKDFLLVGCLPEPYVWDDTSSITAQEFKDIIAKREVTLATLKANREAAKAAKNAPPATETFTF